MPVFQIRHSLQTVSSAEDSSSSSVTGSGASVLTSQSSQGGSVTHSQHIQASHHAHCRSAIPASAKDYVESLHQNSKATLLYGKNNVLVLPKDLTEPIPGYLSLHQTAQMLTIKWTPNQLMNGYTENEPQQDKSSYWDYAMNVNVDEIVYVHCHQQVGPCALEYSKTKTHDHLWTDPRAVELVQMHRISTGTSMPGGAGVTPTGTPPLSRRPALN
ncbi:hypothetical protein J437_LFUL005681, partial [Ladona fulva]